jgi:alpha-D-ribose 1-methylphosphonate 5-triphosphate synthase subunit PhnI
MFKSDMKSEIADTFKGNVELDTFDLVEKVNSLTARQGITQTKLSMKLKMSDMVIWDLLRHPMPWHLLNKSRKDHYTKMHTWLIENEERKESDKSLNRSILEIDKTDTINTNKVASEFVQMLKVNGISKGFVAHGKLRVYNSYFDQLVKKPKPYADLKENERKIFQRMKKWMEPGEIENLKRCFDDFIAKHRDATPRRRLLK